MSIRTRSVCEKMETETKSGDKERCETDECAVKKYVCDICQKTFSSSSSLRRHVDKHEGKGYQCDVCQKSFTAQYSLTMHQRAHDNVKPFGCEKCSARFINKWKCKRHEKACTAQHSDNIQQQTRTSYKQMNQSCGKSCDKCCDNIQQQTGISNNQMNQSHDLSCDKSCDKCCDNIQQQTEEIITQMNQSCDQSCDQSCEKNEPARKKIVLPDKAHHCTLCDKYFRLRSSYRVHMDKHRGKKYQCDCCKKSYTAKYSLIVHQRSHTGSRPYKCRVCDGSFSQRSHCVRHEKSHKGKSSESASNISIPTVKKISYNNNNNNNKKSKLYACRLCKKIFKNLNSLRVHKNKHMGKRYVCKICDSSYTTQYSLKLHMTKHNDVEPWVCVTCGKTYRLRKFLVRHERVHTGMKTRLCDQCGKCFVDGDALTSHRLTHIERPTIQCTVCRRHFKTKRTLEVHMKIHNDQKDFECQICSRHFIQKHSLIKHMAAHSKGDSIKKKALFVAPTVFCELCNKGFAEKYGLKRHLVKHRKGTLKNYERKFNDNEKNSKKDTENKLQIHNGNISGGGQQNENVTSSKAGNGVISHGNDGPDILKNQNWENCFVEVNIEVSDDSAFENVRETSNKVLSGWNKILSKLGPPANKISEEDSPHVEVTEIDMGSKPLAEPIITKMHKGAKSMETPLGPEIDQGDEPIAEPLIIVIDQGADPMAASFITEIDEDAESQEAPMKIDMVQNTESMTESLITEISQSAESTETNLRLNTGAENKNCLKIGQVDTLNENNKYSFSDCAGESVMVVSKGVGEEPMIYSDYKRNDEVDSSKSELNVGKKTEIVCSNLETKNNTSRSLLQEVHMETGCEVPAFQQTVTYIAGSSNLIVDENNKKCRKYDVVEKAVRHRPDFEHEYRDESKKSDDRGAVLEVGIKHLENSAVITLESRNFNISESPNGVESAIRKRETAKEIETNVIKSKVKHCRNNEETSEDYDKCTELRRCKTADLEQINEIKHVIKIKGQVDDNIVTSILGENENEIIDKEIFSSDNTLDHIPICNDEYVQGNEDDIDTDSDGDDNKMDEVDTGHLDDIDDHIQEEHSDKNEQGKCCEEHFRRFHHINSSSGTIGSEFDNGYNRNKAMEVDTVAVGNDGYVHNEGSRNVIGNGSAVGNDNGFDDIDDRSRDNGSYNGKDIPDPNNTGKKYKSKCKICRKSIKETYMNQHLRRFHNGRVYQTVTGIHKKEGMEICRVCNKSFKTSYLSRHLKKYHMVNECSSESTIGETDIGKILNKKKTSNNNKASNNHAMKKGKTVSKCSICNREIKQSYFKRHLKKFHQAGNEGQRFTCSINNCRKIFTSFSEYIYHSKSHCLPKDNRCRVCNLMLCSHSSLSRHMKRKHGVFWDIQAQSSQTFYVVSADGSSTTDLNLRNENSEIENMAYILPDSLAVQEDLVKSFFVNKTATGYTCNLCDVEVDSKENGLLHLDEHAELEKQKINSSNAQFQCKECHKTFHLQYSLKRHMKIHNNYKEFKCEYCGRRFTQKNHLSRHVEANFCKSKFPCKECEQLFQNEGSLRVHLKKVHKQRAYECPLCPKKFTTSSGMNRHKKFHVNGTAETRPVKSYMCTICGKQYTAASTLANHMDTHSGVRRNICDICGKSFVQRAHLLRHTLVVHKGIKKFVCKVEGCRKRYSDSGTLRVHMRLHTGEKPYQCKICEKWFSQQQILKSHQKRHFGHKDFPCPKCDMKLGTKMSLIRHLNRHDVERKMDPKSEDYDPDFKGRNRQKIVKKMAEKTIPCDLCGNKFTTKRGLVAHQKNWCAVVEKTLKSSETYCYILKDKGTNAECSKIENSIAKTHKSVRKSEVHLNNFPVHTNIFQQIENYPVAVNYAAEKINEDQSAVKNLERLQQNSETDENEMRRKDMTTDSSHFSVETADGAVGDNADFSYVSLNQVGTAALMQDVHFVGN